MNSGIIFWMSFPNCCLQGDKKDFLTMLNHFHILKESFKDKFKVAVNQNMKCHCGESGTACLCALQVKTWQPNVYISNDVYFFLL